MFEGSVILAGRKLVFNALRRTRSIPARSSAVSGRLDHWGAKLICAVLALMSIETTFATCDAAAITGAVISKSPRTNSAAGVVFGSGKYLAMRRRRTVTLAPDGSASSIVGGEI